MEREYFAHHIWSRFRGLSTSQPRSKNENTWRTTRRIWRKDQKQPKGCSDYLKYSKKPSQVLDAYRTRLRRVRGLVRPRTAGLLIDIEYSIVRNSSWVYLTSFVTTRIDIELATVQRKLSDYIVVELQLYSTRTFHITMSPGYIKADRDPLQTIINT